MENWNTRKSLLLRASNPDDHEAFEEFVYYYKNFINMVFAKLEVSESLIGDLRQELLLKLWRNIGKFDTERANSNFRGWLSVVIKNEVYGFFRKHKKENDARFSFSEKSPDENDLDRLIETEWKTYITSLALEKMKTHFDGKAMQVFDLTLAGKETAEIASELNLTENSVYSLRTRVKARFQSEIRQIRSFLEYSS